MTPAALNSYSHKDLAQMAKRGGVRGWHSMRKDQLVKALITAAKKSTPASSAKKPATATRRAATKATPARATPHKTTSTRVQRHITKVREKLERFKNLSSENGKAKSKGAIKERIVVMVRDPYWLHAYWEIKRHSVERVQAAMAAEWHTARPFLRLLEIHDGGSTSASERVVRDIEVHGGVNNWYVHVDNSPASYRLELGYMGSSGRFFPLVRSNVVTTPEPGSSEAPIERGQYFPSGRFSPENGRVIRWPRVSAAP